MTLLASFPSATELMIKVSSNETVTVRNYLEKFSTLLVGDQLAADDRNVLYRLMFYLGALTFKKGSNTEMKITNEFARLEFVEALQQRLKKFLGDAEIQRIREVFRSIVQQENVIPFCDYMTEAIPNLVKFGGLVMTNEHGFQFGMNFLVYLILYIFIFLFRPCFEFTFAVQNIW